MQKSVYIPKRILKQIEDTRPEMVPFSAQVQFLVLQGIEYLNYKSKLSKEISNN